MKRVFSYAMFGLAAAVLAGCPIYSDDGGSGYCPQSPGNYNNCSNYSCNSDNDCPSGYLCNDSSACVPSASAVDASANNTGGQSCSQPTDCPSGQNCGDDGTCHAGDCSSSGCPASFVCKLADGTLQCVGDGTNPDAGPIADGGNGSDSGDGQVIPKVDCHNDSECTGAGSGNKCIDGKCVAPADQCSDTTQCPSAEQCVGGVCTPSCATNACPTGYSCDGNKVCTGNPAPCGAASDAGTCGAGTTCVEERCVPNCGAGLSCGTGLVCVGGGCIPDEKAQFVCAQEGVKDACATGSLCLHHSCYIGCDADAGSDACKSADNFNTCKQVVTGSGTYAVCGSSTNLGTDCDPTLAKNCTAGKVCIDGFCK